MVAIFSTAIILVFRNIEDYNTMSLINIILVFIFALVTLAFRSTLLGYNNLVRIAMVVRKQSDPIHFTKNIVREPAPLNKEYTLYTATSNYRLYYNHYQDKTPNVRKRYHLKIVIIITTSTLDFFDKRLHDDIAKLQTIFSKKEIPNKYAIVAFKEYQDMTEDDLKAIGEVVSYTISRQTFTQINVGLCLSDHLAYFLYSKQYVPNRNYQEAVDLIFELTGNPKLEKPTKQKHKKRA